MPYTSMEQVNPAIRGIKPPVTLAQANKIAAWADAMEAAENGPESPWGAAIAQFKKLGVVRGDKWVLREKKAMDDERTDELKAVWSGATVNNFPDSSFLHVEKGGEKDEEGKTKPRSLRHLPVKNADGEPDLAHIRAALSRLGQEATGGKWKTPLTATLRKRLVTKAQGMLKAAGGGKSRDGVLLDGEAKDTSLSQRVNALRDAFHAQSRTSRVAEAPEIEAYVEEVYTDYLVARANGKYWKVPFSETDDGIQFAARADWEEVEQTYEAKAADALAAGKVPPAKSKPAKLIKPAKPFGLDSLISYGGTIKMWRDGHFEGPLVRFTSEDELDLEGEFFNGDTDYDIEDGAKSSTYYQHGADPMLGKRRIGKATLHIDEVQVWAEGQLDLRDKWERAVRDLGLAGKLGLSSGTAPHLVEKEKRGKGVWIKKWPLGLDVSLTPTPAEVGNIVSMKSYRAMDWPSLKAYLPEELPTQGDSVGAGAETKPTKKRARRTVMKIMPSGDNFYVMKTDEEDNIIAGLPVETFDSAEKAQAFIDNLNKPPELRMWERAMAQQNTALEKMVDAQAEAMARLTQPTKGVPYTGGNWAQPTKAATQKEWIDWTIAFLANDREALKKMGSEWVEFKSSGIVEYSDGTKVQGDQTGQAGGFTIPPQFEAFMVLYDAETEIVWPLAKKRTATGRTVTLPTVSLSAAATGQSQYFGGWWPHWTETGHTKHETEIEFGEQELVVHELSAYTAVKDALLEDSAIAFAQFLQEDGRACIMYVTDESFLDGTGSGMPQGVIDAPGTRAIPRQTPGHITYEDAKNMFMNLVSNSRGKALWVINQFCMAEIMDWTDDAGNLIWQPNAREGVPTQIFNRPIRWTEKVPNLGSRGDIGLYDFNHYIIARKPGGLALGRSEHFLFRQNRTAFRWVIRIDGQEDLPAPIETKSGNNWVSPFVVLEEAAETT